MPHIHELIDFTVVAYVVYRTKVLLIHHKELNKWLPLGGHIELDEDPEQALFREVKEESGLEIVVLGEKPVVQPVRRKFLYAPVFLDIHDISDTHRHIGMIYFAKAKSDGVILAEKEHNAIRWFSKEELDYAQFGIEADVIYYAREALQRLLRF